MTSRPVGQEGHCFLVVCSSPWPRKEFDWNGDVATRVDMRTTKVKFFKKYFSEGMSDPGKIIRPGRWMFLTWGRLMKANSQKQRCLVLHHNQFLDVLVKNNDYDVKTQVMKQNQESRV